MKYYNIKANLWLWFANMLDMYGESHSLKAHK